MNVSKKFLAQVDNTTEETKYKLSNMFMRVHKSVEQEMAQGLVWVENFLFYYRTRNQRRGSREFVVSQKGVSELAQRIGFLGWK